MTIASSFSSDLTPEASSQILTSQLYDAWQQAVSSHKLMNQFVAVANDGEGRWLEGDKIAFGVRQHQGQNTYYARNLTQDRPIRGAVEEKRIDGLGFVCQFNGYRALRPGGQLRPCGRQPDISPEAKDCRFSCGDASDPLSLLNREPLMALSLEHFNWRAYYNAAPIDPEGHFLWVPTDSTTALTHLPQQLSLALLKDAFSLFQQFSPTLLFFNALHSGASVNHIHFQAMRCQEPLLAEKWPLSKSTEGYYTLENYPAKTMVFGLDTVPERVYAWIDDMQQKGVPFNLMFLGDRVILIPREVEHEIVSEFPGNGVAALGMCGKIITVNRTAYLNANPETIRSAFEKMTLRLPPR